MIGGLQMDGSSEEAAKARLAERFARLWESSESPPDVFAFLSAHPEATPEEHVEVLRTDMARRWESGDAITTEIYIERSSVLARQPALQVELVLEEYRQRQARGETTSVIVLTESGAAETSGTGEKILKLLLEQLQ